MKPITELTDEELDYWVAKAQDLNVTARKPVNVLFQNYRPTSNWQQAGELIEKYEIDLSKADNWWANVQGQDDVIEGDIPQRAICKAVVASVYGMETEEI